MERGVDCLDTDMVELWSKVDKSGMGSLMSFFFSSLWFFFGPARDIMCGYSADARGIVFDFRLPFPGSSKLIISSVRRPSPTGGDIGIMPVVLPLLSLPVSSDRDESIDTLSGNPLALPELKLS
jgi:hypothetical protein